MLTRARRLAASRGSLSVSCHEDITSGPAKGKCKGRARRLSKLSGWKGGVGEGTNRFHGEQAYNGRSARREKRSVRERRN